MKCAIYTRTTTTESGTDVNCTTIMQQNEVITAFIRSRKWKVSARYSDRKKDPQTNDAYMKLREDALNRKFDIIVAESAFRFGANTYQSLFMLQKILFPAGIHFAFVNDGFCSLDHDEAEVNEYLNELRKRYHGSFTRGWMGAESVKASFSVFGFHYIDDEKRVIADEETSAIVKRVFQRLLAGEIPSVLAKEFNTLGIITPGEYYRRERGFNPTEGRKTWNGTTVAQIARNEKYAGVYKCGDDNDEITIDVVPFVDKKTFDEVQKILWSRYRHKNHHPSYPRAHSITGFIWDKESGLPLHRFRDASKGNDDIRFKYPKTKDVVYDKPYMDYDDFEKQLRLLLIREKAASNKAVEFIYSDAGEAYIAELKMEARKDLPAILSELSAAENEKICAYSEWQDGDISEADYRQIEAICNSRTDALDKRISGIVDSVNEIDKAYSDKNPWIRLFRRSDESIELSKVNLKKILDSLYVYRFEKVEIVPKEAVWKNKLPDEWVEEI